MAKEGSKYTVLNTGDGDNPIYKEIPIRTDNEFAVHNGKNLPNHSSSLSGLPKFVRAGSSDPFIFRTKQKAYRFAAWLICMAETLPDEEGAHTWEQVLEAVQES